MPQAAAVTAAESLGQLLAFIERTWGYRELRPLQEPAMRAFLDRRDSLVVLPTGGGKSLCYQAPAVFLSQAGQGPTVVVSPLIALMKDQVDSLRELGIAASQLNSSLSPDDRRQVASDLRGGRLHLLFVSPERLVGGNGDNYLQTMLRDCGVKTFAIDEAHCISHWGHDFRPEYRKLARLKEMFPGTAVHAFTATATSQVRRDIAQQLQLNNPEILVGNFDRPNLTYRILPRRDLYAQIHEVLERHSGEAGIIYCPRRRDVDEISKALAADTKLARQVAGYHAGMSPELRRRVQNQFIEEECDLIVATIAFGMGIDRSNIRFVLHTAMPKSIEAYQQETGRAGRDSLEAECVLLYSAADPISWKSLIEKSVADAGAAGTQLDPDFLPSALRHIDEMDRFARSATCRHQMLVEYFGQPYISPARSAEAGTESPNGCGACDMCLGDTTPVPDSTIIAQKILSCIARTDQRFGAGHIVSVLRGERTERIRSFRHDQLSTYGLLSSHSQPELRDFIYQLIGQGALAQESLVLANGRSAPIIKLNTHSIEVLKSRRTVRLVQIVRKSAAEARRMRGAALSWEGVDHDLFETLRAWRKKLASARNVPPYVILSDATLRELARSRPSTLSNFRLVYGIGENKLKELGHSIVQLIADYCREKGLSTDVMTSPTAESPPRPVVLRPSPHKELAFRLFQNGVFIDDAMAKTGRARATLTEYLAEFIEREKPDSIDPWVPPASYKTIAAAAKGQPLDRLKPLYVSLNEQFPYDQIRLVVAHLKSRHHS